MAHRGCAPAAPVLESASESASHVRAISPASITCGIASLPDAASPSRLLFLYIYNQSGNWLCCGGGLFFASARGPQSTTPEGRVLLGALITAVVGAGHGILAAQAVEGVARKRALCLFFGGGGLNTARARAHPPPPPRLGRAPGPNAPGGPRRRTLVLIPVLETHDCPAPQEHQCRRERAPASGAQASPLSMAFPLRWQGAIHCHPRPHVALSSA